MPPKVKQQHTLDFSDDEHIASEVEEIEDFDEVDIDETEEVADEGVEDDEENDDLEPEWDGEIDRMTEEKKVRMHVIKKPRAEKKTVTRVFQGSPLHSESDTDIE